MPDFMFTVVGRAGARDVLVMDAPDIRTAIPLAEKATGAVVSHGRTYRTSYRFDPALTVDAADGSVTRHHDNAAIESMQVHRPTGSPTLGRGR